MCVSATSQLRLLSEEFARRAKERLSGDSDSVDGVLPRSFASRRFLSLHICGLLIRVYASCQRVTAFFVVLAPVGRKFQLEFEKNTTASLHEY